MDIRPIDANALLELYGNANEINLDRFVVPILVIRQNIADMPTLDYAPVKHGEWVQNGDFDEECNVYTCSLCGEDWQLNAGNPVDNNMNYCPCCGAKMHKQGGKE